MHKIWFRACPAEEICGRTPKNIETRTYCDSDADDTNSRTTPSSYTTEMPNIVKKRACDCQIDLELELLLALDTR